MSRFHDVLKQMIEVHDRKAKDYGSDNDPYGNFRPAEKYGVPAWLGCQIRHDDKGARIASFAKRGELENESVDDAFWDQAVYGVLVLCLWLDEKERNESGMGGGVGREGSVVDDSGEVVDSMEGTNRVTGHATWRAADVDYVQKNEAGGVVFPRRSSSADE